MIVRLNGQFNWRIPGAGLSCISFPAGDYAVGVQDEPMRDQLRMTRTQADAAISAGIGEELAGGQPPAPIKKGRRNATPKQSRN